MTVKHLTPATVKPEPNVIDALECALELAKSGKLRSVAIVGSFTGHKIYSNFGAADMTLLIGSLAYVLNRVCVAQSEKADPVGEDDV